MTDNTDLDHLETLWRDLQVAMRQRDSVVVASTEAQIRYITDQMGYAAEGLTCTTSESSGAQVRSRDTVHRYHRRHVEHDRRSA